ncbi:uncharacterized protein LOC110712508 [Chenopodium quinoa]|uniref:uncharacterized protein LOC110712508 n=1 Tax=Chenopodium quinoa TaxID=63459 RepID=UPI000B797C48|nr:uncharacterized protein LOC110712508 [Chenopodium quinoa]
MARTMQTATDPNYRSEGSGDQTPEGETFGQGDQTALERSHPRAPSTPADSFLEECDQGDDEAVSAPLTQNEEETESDRSASTSESSDDLPPLEDSEEEERKKCNEKDDPFNIHVSAKDRIQMEENLKDFTQMHPLGEGYRIRVPPENDIITWEDDQENANSYFGCFEAAFKAEEALNMLQKEKTPKRSSTVIRKELAEKAAAAVKAKQLEADLKTANQRVSDAETAQKKAEEAQKKADESAKKADEALKKAQADLGTLKGVSEENTNLKTKVERLKKEAAQAQTNFAATLEVEKNRLVAESDADNDARMKIAWAALYPDADYSVWALAHSYAEYVVYLRDRG